MKKISFKNKPNRNNTTKKINPKLLHLKKMKLFIPPRKIQAIVIN